MARIQVFADESGMHSVPFMLIGGIWIDHDSAKSLRDRMGEICQLHAYLHEVKWERVRHYKLDCVYRLVDAFLEEDGARFECIVVEKRLVDWKTDHAGDKDLGFNMFYSLLVSGAMEPGNEYEITVDSRNSRRKTPLTEILTLTNTWFAKRHGEAGLPPVRRIAAQDSKLEPLIQLADLLLGAVSSAYQPTHSNPGKTKAIEYLTRTLGIASLAQHQRARGGKFNVTEWKHKITERAP